MMLIETIETYRIDNESEVKSFIEGLKQEGFSNGYEVVSYSSEKKEKKAKGEIIDEAFKVKVRKRYDDFWGV